MQIYVKKIEKVVYLQKIYNMSIIFTDLDHSYNSGDIKYTSVSTLISKYKKPFNTEYWSLYKAYEKLLSTEDFKKLKEGFKTEDPALFAHLRFFADEELAKKYQIQILKEWEKERSKSIVKGNMYHEAKETEAIETGFLINPFDNKDYETINSVIIEKVGNKEYRKPNYAKLEDLLDGFHPELLLWNNFYQLAGQADKVYIETIDGIRYVDIDDYKTNKKIKKTNYFQKMHSPISHLDCCNYNHYRLQISTYGWLMEQAGYTIRNLSFTHINQPYEFDYLKDEVEGIIKDNYVQESLKNL